MTNEIRVLKRKRMDLKIRIKNLERELSSGSPRLIGSTDLSRASNCSEPSGQHPTMCNELPSLKLLVHVSAIGTVWFTPNWILAALEALNGKIDQIHHSNGMKQLTPEDVCIGLLCIARHSDGYLYRARVVDQMKSSSLITATTRTSPSTVSTTSPLAWR